jgi:membrane protease YdiL (CAAX protease family)
VFNSADRRINDRDLAEIAPPWHTVLLLGYILSPTSMALHLSQLVGIDIQVRPIRYLIIVSLQWSSILFISYGLHLRKFSLRVLVGRTWSRWSDFRGDLYFALLFLIAFVAASTALYLLLGSPNLDHRAYTSASDPKNFQELAVWIPVAISTGIVEELIFRGYFLRQALAYLKRVDLAIFVQAILFSLAHGYSQTLTGFAHKFLLGVALGILTQYRRGLLPAIMSHSLLDIVAGVTGVI